MTMAWRQLDTPGKISAIRSVWEPGCTSAQIAANFEGVTRNAIIGMYHRYPDSLIDKPLPNRDGGRPKTRKQAVTFLFSKKTTQSLPKPVAIATEQHLAGLPMVALTAKQCRWCVNEPDRFDLHLFCALPTDETYCETHRSRAAQNTMTRNGGRG